MLRRRFALLLVALLTLSGLAGCAHKKAISQANDLAQRGEWRAAYAQCQRALELNSDSEEAQKCAADTRPKATQSALEDARAELRAQNYAGALDHLDYVDSIHDETPAEAVELRKVTRDAVAQRLQAYLENGEMERAYEFAGTARSLYPNADFVETAYATCRAHFTDVAAEHEKNAKYAEAVDALETIATHESDRADAISREQQRIKDIWADSLEEQARALEDDGKLAGAAVKYARAYELSRREKTRVQLTRVANAVRDKTVFTVDWELDGPRDWTRSFEDSLTAQLEKPESVVVADSTPRLTMAFDLKKSDCADAATGTRRASKEYVSGIEKVPNPEYEDIRGDLEDARDALADARDREVDLERDYNDAERKVSRYRADVVEPTRKDVDDAENRVRQLTAEVQSAQQFVDQGEQQLRRLKNDENVSQETIAGQEMTLRTLRKDLHQKQARLEDAERELRELEGDFENVSYELEDLQDDRDDLFTRHKDAEREVTRLEDRVDQLESDLQATPRQREVEVTDTFEYEIIDWKRTCTAEVELSVHIKDVDKRYTLTEEASAETADSEHQAFPEYGVSADPLEYPTDDVELWKQVDKRLADKAFSRIAGHARSFWKRRIDEAVGKMDDEPHAAADMLLSVYLSAPRMLASGHETALSEHLDEYYGASPLSVIAER